MNPIDRMLSLLAPHTCVVCEREDNSICNECIETFEVIPSICYACGRASKNYKPCENHIHKLVPQHVWMNTPYKDGAKELLHAYKFKEQRAAAAPIAKMMEAGLPYFAEQPLITFVPTASQHRRLRGFDHAELIARELSKIRSWRYMRLLHRNAQTRQLGATRKRRKEQLKGVFMPANLSLTAGRHILLIDDVITTGATIEECTKVLYQAGAASVSVAVFARTPEK